MVTQIYASVRDARVNWIGLTRPDKNGRQKPSMQVQVDAPDGKGELVYISSEKAIENLKVNDKVSLDLRVTVYNGGLFCNLVGVGNNGNGAGKAKISI